MLQVRSLTSQSEELGQNAVIWTFLFETSVLFSGGALSFHPACFLPSSIRRESIAESKHRGDFHPECLLLLKRPLREPLTRCWGRGSRPLSLFCSLCRLCSLYADRLARSAFHLLFASSCHKLTVDVHTWPALGRSMARIDGRSTGKGMVLTACQSALWWRACCPRVERLL